MTKASIWRGRVVAVGFGLLFAPLLVKGQTPALEAGLAQLYDLADVQRYEYQLYCCWYVAVF